MEDHCERADKAFHVDDDLSDRHSFRWDHILRTGESVEVRPESV